MILINLLINTIIGCFKNKSCLAVEMCWFAFALEDDEMQLELSLPWLKSVMEIMWNLNLTCTHQGR